MAFNSEGQTRLTIYTHSLYYWLVFRKRGSCGANDLPRFSLWKFHSHRDKYANTKPERETLNVGIFSWLLINFTDQYWLLVSVKKKPSTITPYLISAHGQEGLEGEPEYQKIPINNFSPLHGKYPHCHRLFLFLIFDPRQRLPCYHGQLPDQIFC